MDEERNDSVVARRIQQRRKERKRQSVVRLIILGIILLALIVGIVFGIKYLVGTFSSPQQPASNAQVPEAVTAESIIKEADFLAAGYDYDKAIEKITPPNRNL